MSRKSRRLVPRRYGREGAGCRSLPWERPRRAVSQHRRGAASPCYPGAREHWDLNISQAIGRYVAIVTCACAAGIGAVAGARAFLSTTDIRYGVGLDRALSDPIIGLIFALVASAIGCLFAVPILWHTQLKKTLPVVTGATIIIGAVCGCAGPLGALVALLMCAMVMMSCRAQWPNSADRATRAPTRVVPESAASGA